MKKTTIETELKSLPTISLVDSKKDLEVLQQALQQAYTSFKAIETQVNEFFEADDLAVTETKATLEILCRVNNVLTRVDATTKVKAKKQIAKLTEEAEETKKTPKKASKPKEAKVEAKEAEKPKKAPKKASKKQAKVDDKTPTEATDKETL